MKVIAKNKKQVEKELMQKICKALDTTEEKLKDVSYTQEQKKVLLGIIYSDATNTSSIGEVYKKFSEKTNEEDPAVLKKILFDLVLEKKIALLSD